MPTTTLPGAQGLRLAADTYPGDRSTPVVLLHGGGQTRHAWGSTAAALAREGWPTTAVDLRGHGDSDWSPVGDYSLAAYAADVAALTRSFASPPVLVGASLGGLSSLAALAGGETSAGGDARVGGDARGGLDARAGGDAQAGGGARAGGDALGGLDARAAGVVLVDVAHRFQLSGAQRIVDFMAARPDGFDAPSDAAEAIAAYLPHRPRAADAAGLRKNLRLRDGRWHWHWDPAVIAASRELLGVGGEPTGEVRRSLEAVLGQLEIPVLLVRGTLSDVITAEIAQEFVQLVPAAEIVEVGDAAHMIAGDSNDAFAQTVRAFLARHFDASGVAA